MPDAPSRRLDRPGRRPFELDPDTFARFSERIARFMGTGRFLAIQTVIVLVWIALNVVVVSLRWDPYPFILLNLAFSTQAAYAAPLILLAQNRQDDRDRVSLDEDRNRAERTKAEWGLGQLPVGFGLTEETARAWGLYISTSKGKTSIGIEEPPLFSKPGLFLVSPGQTLYYGSVQTMPFVRPHFAELVKAVDFAIEKDYPARGEYTGAV